MTQERTLTEAILHYQSQIQQGDIVLAYTFLRKFMAQLSADFSKAYNGKYQVGDVSPGYMDYTYFPFTNDALRARKLRFGIVLNHQKMRFELWLMGQNDALQKKY